MIQKILFYLILGWGFLGFSQEKIIEGKITINTGLQSVKVENINREISVHTNQNGTFRLKALPGEVLVFSGVNVNKKILFLKPEHFTDVIEVELKSVAIEIEEVEVGSQIDLGFEGEKLTSAERRYQTGGRILNMNQGIEINLEAVGNLFSGKRKELKKNLKIEKANNLLYELDIYFDEDFYISSLGLEPKDVLNFKYFLVDDKDFQKTLKSEDKTEIIIKTITMYEFYQKIKADEK